jgi:hypothetical protein
MPDDFKVTNAIACEHLASGHAGKYILINTYAGDILVAEFPARVAMAFYVELEPKKFGKLPLNIQLTIDRKVIIHGVSEASFEKGNAAIIAIPDGILTFERKSIFKLSLWVEGSKPVTVLKKEIRLSDKPII